MKIALIVHLHRTVSLTIVHVYGVERMSMSRDQLDRRKNGHSIASLLMDKEFRQVPEISGNARRNQCYTTSTTLKR